MADVEKASGAPLGFWAWIDERLGIEGLRYPTKEHGNSIFYSLGGITFATFLLLIGTGIILAQWYNPDPARAHQSVLYIMNQVWGGRVIRGMHYWLANGAILLVALHAIRVFFTGSYKRPREFNWLVGVSLFFVTIFFFYSGTVLKWDQEGLEALEHTGEIGDLFGRLGTILTSEFTKSVSQLGRMYAVHVSLLPVLLATLVAVHFLLIKRLRISPLPWGSREEIERREEGEPTAPFTAHILRLLVYGVVVLVIVFVLATLIPPPLGQAPRAGIEVTKPPWAFIWITTLETIGGVKMIPIAFGLLLIGLVAWPFIERTKELDPRRRKFAMIVLAVALLAGIVMTVWGYLVPIQKHV